MSVHNVVGTGSYITSTTWITTTNFTYPQNYRMLGSRETARDMSIVDCLKYLALRRGGVKLTPPVGCAPCIALSGFRGGGGGGGSGGGRSCRTTFDSDQAIHVGFPDAVPINDGY